MAKYYTSTRFRPTCPTCGNKIGQLEESYKRLMEQGKTPAAALDSLGIERPCCRVRSLWPVVMPLGAFYLPFGEASMLNYLGLKPADPQPNLVVLSLRRAATGENFIISHVDADGFIGRVATGTGHEPTEVVIGGIGETRKIVMRDSSQLAQECAVRVQTEPGEITRGFPFEIRAFRRDVQVDRVKSYFDLAPQELEVPDEDIISGGEVKVEDLIAAEENMSDDEDEPLVAAAAAPADDAEEEAE